MKSVYLDYTSDRNMYYVTEYDFIHAIRPMVMKMRRCSKCERYYELNADPPRPCVGKRICMQCFLHKHNTLRFLEIKYVNDDNEATLHVLSQRPQINIVDDHSA